MLLQVAAVSIGTSDCMSDNAVHFVGCQSACFAGAGGDNEVQRTMLEIVNQLDGFDSRGNIKVLMATNRPDTLDPALLRPGRLDRKVGCCGKRWPLRT